MAICELLIVSVTGNFFVALQEISIFDREERRKKKNFEISVLTWIRMHRMHLIFF